LTVAENDSLVFVVSAVDPDGGAIDSLTATGLPGGATFTIDPGDSTGTFRWTPATGQAGIYTVSFQAAHGIIGTDSTVITVSSPVAGVRIGPPQGPPLEPRIAPNPIRDRAHLRFAIAHDGPLTVRVFDVAGRVVRTLLDEPGAVAGDYDLSLDVGGRDGPLPQGLYFYRIETRHGSARGRFLVVR
jgi:hypothetical protein